MTKTYNILATTLLTLAMMIAVGMLTSCNIEIVKNDDKNDETKVFNVKEFSRIEASVDYPVDTSVRLSMTGSRLALFDKASGHSVGVGSVEI